MYLSFFIKEETIVLEEIRQALEEMGFRDIKCSGKIDKHRIVIFNGRKRNNFSYTAHKLVKIAPDEAKNNPFLVRAGSDWTIQGLKHILTSYAKFQLPHFSSLHFPRPEDFFKSAENERFLLRMQGIKQGLLDCEKTTEEEVKKMNDIFNNLNGKTVGEVKRKMFYFFFEEDRIRLPWGNPPTGKKARNQLIEWLKEANDAYPRKRTSLRQAQNDLRKIKSLKDTSKIKLT
ncbi:MAG: hypothetical protein ACQEP3_01660 [Patescibacteria group bacterium]